METEKSRQLLSSEDAGVEDLLKTIKTKRKKSKENFGKDSDSDDELDNAHKRVEYIEKEYL